MNKIGPAESGEPEIENEIADACRKELCSRGLSAEFSVTRQSFSVERPDLWIFVVTFEDGDQTGGRVTLLRTAESLGTIAAKAYADRDRNRKSKGRGV